MPESSSKKTKDLVQQVSNLKTTLNHIGAYVFTKDLEGRYTYVNELVRELFDCPLEEIVGFDDSKFFELALSNDIKINDQKVMQEGAIVEEEERNVIAQTGEVRFYQTVKKPLYDDQNTIIGMFGVSTDITERKLMEFELKQQQELLNTVLNNVDAFIYMKDVDYKYLYLNPKTAALFGKLPEELLGRRDDEFLPEAEANSFRKMDVKLFETGDVQSGEESFIDEKGKGHHYWSTKVPIKDEAGQINSYIGISADITELSTKDALTGINNRRTLDIELTKQFSQFKEHNQIYSVIMADIDSFKSINDLYGHFEGDKALQMVSKSIEKNVEQKEVVGRWGGEEFLIFCVDSELQDAIVIAEKIRTSVESLSSNLPYDLTLSLGVSEVSGKDSSPCDVTKRADSKLYQAKSSGRNQVVY